jgi:hypothetical protein
MQSGPGRELQPLVQVVKKVLKLGRKVNISFQAGGRLPGWRLGGPSSSSCEQQSGTTTQKEYYSSDLFRGRGRPNEQTQQEAHRQR